MTAAVVADARPANGLPAYAVFGATLAAAGPADLHPPRRS